MKFDCYFWNSAAMYDYSTHKSRNRTASDRNLPRNFLFESYTACKDAGKIFRTRYGTEKPVLTSNVSKILLNSNHIFRVNIILLSATIAQKFEEYSKLKSIEIDVEHIVFIDFFNRILLQYKNKMCVRVKSKTTGRVKWNISK